MISNKTGFKNFFDNIKIPLESVDLKSIYQQFLEIFYNQETVSLSELPLGFTKVLSALLYDKIITLNQKLEFSGSYEVFLDEIRGIKKISRSLDLASIIERNCKPDVETLNSPILSPNFTIEKIFKSLLMIPEVTEICLDLIFSLADGQDSLSPVLPFLIELALPDYQKISFGRPFQI